MDSSLASGAVRPPCSATAAKPVMNITRIAGSIALRLLGQLDPVHLRHDDVGQQQVVIARLRAAASPRCRSRPPRLHSRRAAARAADIRASTYRLRPGGFSIIDRHLCAHRLRFSSVMAFLLTRIAVLIWHGLGWIACCTCPFPPDHPPAARRTCRCCCRCRIRAATIRDWLIAMLQGRRAGAATRSRIRWSTGWSWRAIDTGIGAVIASAPRAAIDCNRAEDEIDPTVDRGSGPIAALSAARPRRARHRSRPHGHATASCGGSRSTGTSSSDGSTQVHRPYHRAIERAARRACSTQFGCALAARLPFDAAAARRRAVGRHRRPPRAERRAVAERRGACRSSRAVGFRAALNEPFAGGHIVAAPRRARRAASTRSRSRSTAAATSHADVATRGPGFDRRSRGCSRRWPCGSASRCSTAASAEAAE